MKKQIIILIILIRVLSITASAVTGVAPANENKSTGFVENKGQITDQYNEPRPEVLYLFSKQNFKMQLKTWSRCLN